MPVVAKIYVLVKGQISFDHLTCLRQEIKRVSGCEDEDFYYDTPLVILDKEDYPFTPSVWEEYTWIDVNTLIRYYDINYEKGSLLTIMKIVEWLEYVLPKCQIYYGSDADERVRLFDEAYKKSLLAYYRKKGYK
jgi:hypothetical protein